MRFTRIADGTATAYTVGRRTPRPRRRSGTGARGLPLTAWLLYAVMTPGAVVTDYDVHRLARALPGDAGWVVDHSVPSTTMNSTRRRPTRDPRRQSRTALVDGTPRRDGRRRRARDGFGRGRHGAPTGRDSSERVRHGRGGGSVTGKLWECGQCNRLVNRFVNGCRCPNCGWYCGRSLVTVIRGP